MGFGQQAWGTVDLRLEDGERGVNVETKVEV